MDPRTVPAEVAAIDELLTEAWSGLRVARGRFQVSPSGEAATSAMELESRLNELLEARSALTAVGGRRFAGGPTAGHHGGGHGVPQRPAPAHPRLVGRAVPGELHLPRPPGVQAAAG